MYLAIGVIVVLLLFCLTVPALLNVAAGLLLWRQVQSAFDSFPKQQIARKV